MKLPLPFKFPPPVFHKAPPTAPAKSPPWKFPSAAQSLEPPAAASCLRSEVHGKMFSLDDEDFASIVQDCLQALDQAHFKSMVAKTFQGQPFQLMIICYDCLSRQLLCAATCLPIQPDVMASCAQTLAAISSSTPIPSMAGIAAGKIAALRTP